VPVTADRQLGTPPTEALFTFPSDGPEIRPAEVATPDTRPSSPSDDPAPPVAPTTSAPDPSTTPPDNSSGPSEEPDASIETPAPVVPPNDVTVLATARELDDEVWNVNIDVDGLGDGGGTVIVNPSNASENVDITADPLCHEIGGGDFECVLGADAPDSFNLMVLVDEHSPNTQFSVEVRPAAGVQDVDASNNTDAATVTPAA
jgi:hypothetical protein